MSDQAKSFESKEFTYELTEHCEHSINSTIFRDFMPLNADELLSNKCFERL